MSKILIIEDEEKVAEILKAYLEKAGYEVFTAISGRSGLDIFKEKEFNLVILDLMLPDITGEEICKTIRNRSEVNRFNMNNSDVHIFMLTAKGSLVDKIEGLNIGADEYLVKPFSPRELVARVNALFRRLDSDNTNNLYLSFNEGKLIIDYEKRIVKINGEAIAITSNEFDILYTLVINNGKVLSREQIIDKVFGIDFEGYDRTIDVHIKNIRKKIEEDSRNPKYIITVTKVGYKFGGER
ncbi:response regulator transcription factor [Clostridium intestinale]|uniref:Stage 0 sporulation protein A homolog n=2 Tax=Clostridium intestinale TaxID=36845 RepID=U2NUM3_9CLOT|nr:response regulator transcription factor [Clostridium intestinale]ERK32536.1 DNA-binding response regulator [Clostridium intestinale URNW]QLY79450.1 response regulator transcription factor [Clostridium intestinale]